MNFLKNEVDNYNHLIDDLKLYDSDKLIGGAINSVKKELQYKTDKEIFAQTNKTRAQIIQCLYTLQYI